MNQRNAAAWSVSPELAVSNVCAWKGDVQGHVQNNDVDSLLTTSSTALT